MHIIVNGVRPNRSCCVRACVSAFVAVENVKNRPCPVKSIALPNQRILFAHQSDTQHAAMQTQHKPRSTTTIVCAAARSGVVSRRLLLRKPSQTPAAVAQRVAVQKLDGVDVLGSCTIPLGLLTGMLADGSLHVEPAQHNVFWASRKLASSLVIPVIQGKDTPPVTLEATPAGCFRVLGGAPRLSSVRNSCPPLKSPLRGSTWARHIVTPQTLSGFPSLTVCAPVALLLQLLAFVTGSNDVGGQHWPAAPVELDSRDDTIWCAGCPALLYGAAAARAAQPSPGLTRRQLSLSQTDDCCAAPRCPMLPAGSMARRSASCPWKRSRSSTATL